MYNRCAEILGTRQSRKPGMALEKELETYRRKLPELKEYEGKYALVQGDAFVDVYSTYEDALKEGYERFQLKPFLVKKVESQEQIHTITRMLHPQCLTSH